MHPTTSSDHSDDAPVEDLTGRVLAGRYRVVRTLGHGGMGAVYEAADEQLGDRRVAVKRLHEHLLDNADQVARFRREATAAAGLGHANIVQVIDFVHRPGEPALLVMEYLTGAALSTVIARDGPLATARAAFIAQQVLLALSAAHAAHIVHRDLKPDNVFLTRVSGVSDVVKLLDFGVAKLLDDAPGANATRARLTATGAVLGTPAYMAPEQARGRAVDHRVDLYALGVLLYESLTARLPFVADNYNALLFAILEDTPVPLAALRPDVPAGLAAVVARAMARDPDARFASAEAMLVAIEPFAAASIGPSSSVPPRVQRTDGAEYSSAPTLASGNAAPTPPPAWLATRATPPANAAPTPVAMMAPPRFGPAPTPVAEPRGFAPPMRTAPASTRPAIHPALAAVIVVVALIGTCKVNSMLDRARGERRSEARRNSVGESWSREQIGHGLAAFADAAGIPLPIAEGVPPQAAADPDETASDNAPVRGPEASATARPVLRSARWTGGVHHDVLPGWTAANEATIARLDPCVSRADFVQARYGFEADVDLNGDGRGTAGRLVVGDEPPAVRRCFEAAFTRMDFGPTVGGRGGTVHVEWRVVPGARAR